MTTTCPTISLRVAAQVPGVTMICPVGGVNPSGIVNVRSTWFPPAEFSAVKVHTNVFPVLFAATS
jgi:hypothetical protein